MPSAPFDLAKLERRIATLEASAPASLRFGRVTSTDGGFARVEVQDGDKVVSHTLPTIQRRVLKDQEIKLPDIGEPVAILCSGKAAGQEDGIMLGAVYSPSATAPDQPQHVEFSRFADGTTIYYDREGHKLYASVQGDVEVITTGNISVECQGELTAKVTQNVSISTEADASITAVGRVEVDAAQDIALKSATNINLTAPFITLNGLIMWGGTMQGAPGTAVFNGNVMVRNGGVDVPDKDVTAGSVSVRKHVHEHSGGTGNSGTPVGG